MLWSPVAARIQSCFTLIGTSTVSKTPYIKRIPGRSGFYAQRAVPRPLQHKLGKKTWIRKVGNTMQEARRNLADFLNFTDLEIANASGQVNEALHRHVDSIPTYGIQEDLGEQGLTPQDIYPRHSLEDAHKLVERQAKREAGERYADRTWDELLTLATRLKSPAPQTISQWKTRVKEVLKIIGKEDPTTLTADDARKYRDYMLDTVSTVTLKNRVRSLKGILNVAKAEDWLDVNPFDALDLRMIKGTTKKKEAVKLDLIDEKVRADAIPDYQQTLYWLMRYTGCHVSEAAGIQHKDIDLKNGVLSIVPNELRQLKNQFREREIPMIDELKAVLSKLPKGSPDAHVFPGLYNEKESRWGHSLGWTRKIGVSPKACRDCVATTLRDADVNERVIGALLGHTPVNSTGVYGAVSMEAKKKALENLTSD